MRPVTRSGRSFSARAAIELLGLATVVALVMLVVGAHLVALWTGEKQYEPPSLGLSGLRDPDLR